MKHTTPVFKEEFGTFKVDKHFNRSLTVKLTTLSGNVSVTKVDKVKALEDFTFWWAVDRPNGRVLPLREDCNVSLCFFLFLSLSLCTHLFNRYLLSIYYGAWQCAGYFVVSLDHSLLPLLTTLWSIDEMWY